MPADTKIMALAREIALNIRPIQSILETLEIDPDQFQRIKSQPRFQSYLESERQAWNSTLNASERVKLKSLSMLEEWLPEAHRRIIDRTESLNAKAEVVKILSRFAGFGVSGVSADGGGEKIKISINLGADTLSIEKQVTPQVIDHDPVD
jgi:hypothetical protein